MPLLPRIMFVVFFTLLLVLLVVVIKDMFASRDSTSTQVTAVAEDMGCKVIEQSYHHPENFYVDCGDGNIQIITLGAK